MAQDLLRRQHGHFSKCYIKYKGFSFHACNSELRSDWSFLTMSKSCLFFCPFFFSPFPQATHFIQTGQKVGEGKKQPNKKQTKTNQKNTPGIWELPGYYRKHSQPDLKDGGGDEMTLRQEFSNPLGLTSPNPSLQQVGLALAIKE